MLFGFSIWVIVIAVAIVALISFIYDIEWYKVAIVVIAILVVSALYRDGKLPEKLEPVAEKVFFWVDKEEGPSNQVAESKDLQKTENKDQKSGTKIKDLWNSLIRKRIFGIRLWTLLVAIGAVWYLNQTWDIGLYYLIPGAAVFLIVAFLYSNDKLPEFLEPVAGRVYRAENNIDEEKIYRPSYDAGTCRDLSGTPYVLCLYVDDDESSWSVEEAEEFQRIAVIPDLAFLNEEAARWGVSLEFGSGMIISDSSRNISVRYDGTILTLMDGEGYTPKEEILKQVINSMGFSSADEFYQYFQDITGAEQVAILLLVNKDGRSHAGIDFSDDNGDDVECTTIFSSLGGRKTISVNHELLHLFGAEDLYEEKSTGENAARAAIAKIHYPNDIMLSGSNKSIGAYTAYAVGWTDEVPEVCTAPEFWEGHWSRE